MVRAPKRVLNTPTTPASELKLDTKRRGRDGTMWVVKKGDCGKKWVRVCTATNRGLTKKKSAVKAKAVAKKKSATKKRSASKSPATKKKKEPKRKRKETTQEETSNSITYKGVKWRRVRFSDFDKLKRGDKIKMWQNNSGNAKKIGDGWNELSLVFVSKSSDGKNIEGYYDDDSDVEDYIYEYNGWAALGTGADPVYARESSKLFK